MATKPPVRQSKTTLSEPTRLTEFLQGVTLNRAIPLRDQIYLLVRKAIVTGKISPGSPINEVEIATRLGISRTPVREAVKKASDEGLVDVFAQNGTFVADISRKQVEEAYIIRIALELESIRRAASVISTSQLMIWKPSSMRRNLPSAVPALTRLLPVTTIFIAGSPR